jgi:hypothetical protein
LNESVKLVITTELASLIDNIKDSVEVINDKYLKLNANNYLSVVEGAKLLFDLNPSENKLKSIELITKFDTTKNGLQKIELKKYEEILSLFTVQKYFGNIDDKIIDDFKLKLSALYPHANAFQTKQQYETQLNEVLFNLSANLQQQSTTEIENKMNKTTLNGSV